VEEGLLQLHGSGLFTDLYELTMSGVYMLDHPEMRAVFELWVREMPENRGFLVYAGLEHALDYLQRLHFSSEEIEYLREQEVFSHLGDEFFDMLSRLRFTGDVWAMKEGSVFFAGEPVMRVRAPIIEAQLVETALLSLTSYSTAIASKAARICHAASLDGRRRSVVDFGARRAPGPGAAVYAARASYIAGCDGTSNVYAGRLYGIPIFGTMAHSFVLAYEDELASFKSYHRCYPESTVLLIDTFDTIAGAEKAAMVGRVRAVRLDSGDVPRLSKKVREILDGKGLRDTGIFVSGDLDEHRIAELIAEGAPVNGFGVGTRLVTSSDAPYVSSIYKLVEVEEKGVRRGVSKLSSGKETYPGGKQVHRFEEGGRFAYDLVALEEEEVEEGGAAMLSKVMERGRVRQRLPSIRELRSHAIEQLSKLPDEVKSLESPRSYEVRFSKGLEELQGRIRRRVRA